mmetsp:Transcript_25174/g.70160  ORF Transcript_25174/g.70160 Transcript_25174/m.70160 type:complete len:231 (-) Transcript_25174:201-893(-)
MSKFMWWAHRIISTSPDGVTANSTRIDASSVKRNGARPTSIMRTRAAASSGTRITGIGKAAPRRCRPGGDSVAMLAKTSWRAKTRASAERSIWGSMPPAIQVQPDTLYAVMSGFAACKRNICSWPKERGHVAVSLAWEAMRWIGGTMRRPAPESMLSGPLAAIARSSRRSPTIANVAAPSSKRAAAEGKRPAHSGKAAASRLRKEARPWDVKPACVNVTSSPIASMPRTP